MLKNQYGILLLTGYLFTEAFRFGLSLADMLGPIFPNHWTIESAFATATYALSIYALFEIFLSWRMHRMAYVAQPSHMLGLLGLLLAISFPEFLSGLYSILLSRTDSLQVFSVLCIIPFYFCFQRLSSEKDEAASASLFLNDDAISHSSDDYLALSERAHEIAERIYDSGKNTSLTFGLDAPWGTGKTSFINICQEYWEENHPEDVIIFRFSPINYSSDTSLLDHFVESFVACIRSKVFAPELTGVARKYLRSIDGQQHFNVFGISLPTAIVYGDDSTILNKIENTLRVNRKKVIAIIDDLDRVKFEESREVLFALRKGFSLNYVSFLVAYDSEVLARQRHDTGALELAEYLEKFINVKISLYLDRSQIRRYLLQVIPQTYEGSAVNQTNLKWLIQGFVDLTESESFPKYKRLLTDIRKIKRLLNTVILAGLHKVDLQESDILPYDFSRLLLLYVNFPSVFGDVYTAETDGQSGFFSVVAVSRREDGREYTNSSQYAAYVDSIADGPLKALVEELFSADFRFRDTYYLEGNMREEALSTWACFNNSFTGRNLEDYLKTIVEVASPESGSRYVFFRNRFSDIKKGDSFASVLSMPEFDSEKAHIEFWKFIVNRSRELEVATAHQAIDLLIDSVSKYSLFDREREGMRFRVPIFLAQLLNDVGWDFVDRDNSIAKIAELLPKIYGPQGILESWSRDSSVLAINDMLMFKLYCSANRGDDLFNLTAALTVRSPNGPIRSGPVLNSAIEGLREIAQSIFRTFSARYVSTGQSVIEDILKLEAQELGGEYKRKSSEKENTAQLRNQLMSFVLYQLASNSTSNGVACGYYDPDGNEDRGQIRVLINEYLFDTCFDHTNKDRVEHFVMFLMTQYERDLIGEDTLSPKFGRVLDLDRLGEYWKSNEKEIFSALRALDSRDYVVHTHNYVHTAQEMSNRLVPDVEATLTNLPK